MAEWQESKIYMAREFGDFQTPPELVTAVLNCLKADSWQWTRALEPTCGVGNFIRGLLDSPKPPAEIRGFEIQDSHLEIARRINSSKQTEIVVESASLFNLNLKHDIKWRTDGPLLVIGNPPWVTNSELGVLESFNLPRKSNLKNLLGLEAITGSANFDLTEFIWIKLITELADQRPTIALLCKTSVARNVLLFLHDRSIPLTQAWLRRIDAQKFFGAAVDACLFYVEIGSEKCSRYEAEVFADLQATQPVTSMCVVNSRVVMNRDAYQQVEFVDGVCPMTWRQGVKHDAASVVELEIEGELLKNKLGEQVDVEPDYVFPLIKGSELFRGDFSKARRQLIVPQRKIGEDTRGLAFAAPELWSYLNNHSEAFLKRKSSIYNSQPPFSIFGIGDYSFAPFKVGVSGLHKQPRFRFIGQFDAKPVMLDDTSYFIACHSAEQAALIAALLNHPLTITFFDSAMFTDAKRPVTKKLLQRIDLNALLSRIDSASLIADAQVEIEKWGVVTEKLNYCWPNELKTLLSAKPTENQMRLFAAV